MGELAEGVLLREHRAIARALTTVENQLDGADALTAALAPHSTATHFVGITGPAGAGKSTLTAQITRQLRTQDERVAVLAVDPSGTSGGAILGDRVRMTDLASDPDVFVRSVATRGALGGLSRATLDSMTVLAAAGYDYVVIETVGVGQAETDILGAAHTVVVVSVPGLGDEVQALKGGLLQIADIHVVNKADRDGARRTTSELRAMLRRTPVEPQGWTIPVLETIASRPSGIVELVESVREHRVWLETNLRWTDQVRRVARMRTRWLVETLAAQAVEPGDPTVETVIDEVVSGRRGVASAAHELLLRVVAGQLS